MGLAVGIAKLRWLFVGMAVAGLGTSFYFTWWRRPTRRNKVIFAVTAVLVAGALSYPAVNAWRHRVLAEERGEAEAAPAPDLREVLYRVEGMT